VTYSYEDTNFNAIEDIDLRIGKGECVAILGENGSGKTTLIKHINGLLRPTRGNVRIDGKETKGMTIAELSKKVGFVFQNPDHMIFADTVEEEVSFGPKNLEGDPKGIKRRVGEVLAFTRLERYRDSHPMSLSGGEKQRLALASIIISEPEILILDEPTTGLDYNSVLAMVQLIKKLKESGKTIILIPHANESLSAYGCSRKVSDRLFSSMKTSSRGPSLIICPSFIRITLFATCETSPMSWGMGANLTPDELVYAMMEGKRK